MVVYEDKGKARLLRTSGKFGHTFANSRNPDDLIRISTVCLVSLFFIPIINIRNKQGRCPNLADCTNLTDYTLYNQQDNVENYHDPHQQIHCIFVL